MAKLKTEVVKDEMDVIANAAALAQSHEELRPGDIAWSDFVLSQLQAKEMDPKGRPKVAGLRRLVAKLIGPIIEAKPLVVQIPSAENERRCTVVYTVTVEDRFVNRLVSVSGLADSYHGNTPVDFRVFPAAMAETRAEGRALKKILMLDAVTSEELAPDDAEVIVSDGDDFITDNQKSTLSFLGAQVDVNVDKAFHEVLKKGYNYKVSSQNASKVIERLSSYRKDVSAIPAELKGYVPDWS